MSFETMSPACLGLLGDKAAHLVAPFIATAAESDAAAAP